MNSRSQALDKLSVGTYGTQGDQLDWSYWDTATIAAATTVQTLFATPYGSAKNKNMTNLPIAAQIPQGQHFDVRAIGIMYKSASAKGTAGVQKVYDLFEQTTLEVKLGNKESIGIWTLQELLGAATLIAVTPTAAGDNIPFIQPAYKGEKKLNRKIVLAALTPFNVILTHWTAADATCANDLLKVTLKGILTRVT